MNYGHPLKFGTFITPVNNVPEMAVALARRSEDLGYDLVTFQDHPYQPAFLDTWTLMSHGLRNEMKESRPMGNVFRSRRGTQARLKRSERFTHPRGDLVAITVGPIPLKVGIIKRPFIFHAAFLHDPSRSEVLCFTFRDDSLGEENRKLIGKGRS